MAASQEYLSYLQRKADALTATNERIIMCWFDAGMPDVDIWECVRANRIEAERYRDMVSWHSRDNGEYVWCAPAVKPWRD